MPDGLAVASRSRNLSPAREQLSSTDPEAAESGRRTEAPSYVATHGYEQDRRRREKAKVRSSANVPTGRAEVGHGASGDEAVKRPGAPAAFPVARIKESGKDSQGREITRIYALRPGKYAVYLAGDVRVEYANDPEEEARQRARIVSSIGKARAEITSLLVGWGQERRRVYDCKVAMALELALEGKVDEARSMVEEAKTELVQERATAGRLQYVGYAAAWCLPLLGLLVSGEWAVGSGVKASDNLLMAGQAGLIGAAFSIALAVRSRTVALDTDRWSNASDGLLRLAIGMLSGGVLLLLLSSGMVPKLVLGESASVAWSELGWKGVLVVGFVAGFLERLVPDLLDKATVLPVGAPSQSKPS